MEASYTAYRPQSSETVEDMNRTLKTTLAKLCQETQLSWIDIVIPSLTPSPIKSRPLAILP